MTSHAGFVGDTVVIVRKSNSIYSSRVDELLDECRSADGRDDFSGVEIWTGERFQPLDAIHTVVSDQQLVRVMTCTGVVDCTSDYKLLRQKGATTIGELTPAKSKLAHQLDLSTLLQQYDFLPEDVECTDAFALGAFASFGSCCTLTVESGAYWYIEHKDAAFLTEVKKCLLFQTTVFDPVPPSENYRLSIMCDERPICAYYREKFYNKHGDKRVPDFIMNASKSVITRFWAGLLPHGRKVTEHTKSHGTPRVDGKQLTTDIWLLGHRIGFHMVLYETLSSFEPDPKKFDLHCLWLKSKYDPSEVRYIYELGRHGEKRTLYQIKLVDSNRLSVGPGNLIVPTLVPENVKPSKNN